MPDLWLVDLFFPIKKNVHTPPYSTAFLELVPLVEEYLLDVYCTLVRGGVLTGGHHAERPQSCPLTVIQPPKVPGHFCK